MRKIYILCFLSLVILQQSCSKDSFDYQQAPISEDAVDTLVFNPSHYILNADGRSALYLKLLPSYYDTEDKSYAATIPLSWFDRKDYGYFYENPDGTIVELENDYLIADPSTPSKTIKVFARVFGKETRKVDVEIRSAWGKGIQEKVIPVVFHIFQYTGTANTEFIIEPVHLNDRMNKLNNAFCRLVSSGASATDTKIRFELATHSVQGRPMAIAGMNKVKFGAKELNPADFDDFYESDGTFNWASFLKYYGVAWAPGTFLNIWILPVGKEKLPSYIPAVIAEGKTPLKGLTLTEVDESYIPEVCEAIAFLNY